MMMRAAPQAQSDIHSGFPGRSCPIGVSIFSRASREKDAGGIKVPKRSQHGATLASEGMAVEAVQTA